MGNLRSISSTILAKGERKQGSIFPLNQKRSSFFFSARYALTSGVEALEIGSGDALLVPSYNCGARDRSSA